MWNTTAHLFPIHQKFSDSIILTNVNGFKGYYSFNNLVPYQSTPSGMINLDLYKGIQDNWKYRQTRNNVAIPIETAEAIDSSMSVNETDKQANIQYFNNPNSPNSKVRIVVLGHTHFAKIKPSNNLQNQKCIYANSGTWIDNNTPNHTMTFVVIAPQNKDASPQTLVNLYDFENEVVTLITKDSLSN